MRHTLFLFDVDATILRTQGAGVRMMHQTARELYGDEFEWAIDTSGMLDPVIFAEAVVANGVVSTQEHHEVFRTRYLAALEGELARVRHDVEVMPGIRESLQQLHDRRQCDDDVMLGVLTGNYGRGAEIKLAAADIDIGMFEITSFAEEAETRPGLVRIALDKYHALAEEAAVPEQVIIIGDTPRDIDCAHVHGCVAFAVATGRFSVDELREAGADYAVESLADPTPLLQLADR